MSRRLLDKRPTWLVDPRDSSSSAVAPKDCAFTPQFRRWRAAAQLQRCGRSAQSQYSLNDAARVGPARSGSDGCDGSAGGTSISTTEVVSKRHKRVPLASRPTCVARLGLLQE